MEKAAVSCLLSTAGIFLQNSHLSAPILCSLSNLLSCDLVFGRGDLFPSPTVLRTSIQPAKEECRRCQCSDTRRRRASRRRRDGRIESVMKIKGAQREPQDSAGSASSCGERSTAISSMWTAPRGPGRRDRHAGGCRGQGLWSLGP